MSKETELDKAVVALEKAEDDMREGLFRAARLEVAVALVHLAAHDIWLQELLTTKTIEDAAFEHPKE